MKHCICAAATVISCLFLCNSVVTQQTPTDYMNLERKADSLRSEGEIFAQSFRYEAAIDRYMQALEIDRELKNSEGIAYGLKEIGDAYCALGLLISARAYYDSALVVLSELDDRQGEAACLANIGTVYHLLHEYDQALAYQDSALAIFKEMKDRRGEGITYMSIGLSYRALSQYDNALAYYDSSFTIMLEVNDRNVQGSIIINVGDAYYALNQYEKALTLRDSALKVFREMQDEMGEGVSLLGIGHIYYVLGEYDRTLAYCDSALKLVRKMKDRYGEGLILQGIGLSYLALSQHDKALAYCDSSLMIMEEMSDNETQGTIIAGIGDVYYSLRQYEKAYAYYDSALMTMREVAYNRGEAQVLQGLGKVYCAFSQYENAFAYHDSALVINRKLRDRQGEASVLYDIGRVYEKIDDIEKAVYYYKKSIGIKESIRGEFRKEELRISYVEAEKDIYDHLVTLLIMLERYDEAFDYLERSRSDKLRRSFEEGDIVAYDPSLRRALERINFLEVEVEGLKKRFRNREIEEDEFERKCNELEGKLNQKLVDLKTYHPQLYDVLEPQRKTLKQIQETIPGNTIFLEFILARDRYLVVFLSNNKFSIRLIEERRQRIDSLTIAALSAIKARGATEQIDECGGELYNLLIKPFESDLDKFAAIVFIPCGKLHYLPFHALKRKNERGDFEYLLEWKCISYLPSASFLGDLLEEKEQAHNDLLAFGNADGTLPNSEVEVDSIAEVFAESRVLKGEEASKDRFIDLCGEYRFIHVATHGILNADPRFSYLVFAPKGGGNLTVREILGLSGRFKLSSLITLSACNTAVEKDLEEAGIELMTLSNAFKVAGVPSIVASLWEIADVSTALLMRDYYKHLKMDQMSKIEALRRAQISMINHSSYAHPYYWAPFVLMGEWR